MKEIMRTIRQAGRLITWNLPVLLLFDLGYKFLLWLLLPLGQSLFTLAIHLAGVRYLSTANFFQLFSHPLSVLIYLFLLFALTFVVLIEVFAFILYFDQARRRAPVRVFPLFWQALKRAGRIFLPHNMPLLLVILVILPLSGVSLSSGVLDRLRIPDFILDFIYQKPLLSGLYVLIIAALALLAFRLIFCIHQMCLTSCRFTQACRTSHRLLKGHAFHTLGTLACWYAIAALTAFLVAALCLLMLAGVVKYLTPAANASLSYWYSYARLHPIGQLMTGIYFLSCTLAIVSALYYQYRPAASEPADTTENPPRRGKLKQGLKMAAALLLAALYAQTAAAQPLDSLFPAKLYIAAHRAGAAMAPENTLAALSDSIQAGADYAEIDVQQTKDGELIILHDSSFERTAGVKKNVWDVTLEEVRTYQTGYIVGQGQIRIPTLTQMLQAAKGKIKLMIELKPNGHEQELERKTLDLIRANGMADQCVIASLDYHILERVKKLAPDIPTCYIAAISYGDLKELSAADMLSIEETFVTPSLLLFAREQEKQVFAWTINREDDMRRMVQMGVDGVVTDNPYLADYVIKEGGRDVLAGTLADLFFPAEDAAAA